MAIDWNIRGWGAGAMVIAYCTVCKGEFEIEPNRVSPTVHIRHCGNTRNCIPERVYECWWIAREGKKRDEIPAVRYV